MKDRIIELLKQMQQFPDFYRVVLGAQSDAFVSQRFRQQTQQRAAGLLPSGVPRPPLIPKACRST